MQKNNYNFKIIILLYSQSTKIWQMEIISNENKILNSIIIEI